MAMPVAQPAFHEVFQNLSKERPLHETLDLIARRVSELAGFSFCGVILPDSEARRIHLAGSHGFPPAYALRLSEMYLAPIGQAPHVGSPTQRAMQSGRTVVIADVLADETFAPWGDLAREFGYRSLVSFPLVSQGQVIGVLNGYSRRPRQLTADETATIETLASQAALAVRLATLVESQHETIDALQSLNDRLSRQQTVLERAHEIHLRLTEAVIEDIGFEGVAQTLADLVGRSVAVIDDSGELVCMSATDEQEALTKFAKNIIAELPPLRRSPAGPVTTTLTTEDTSSVIGHIRIGHDLLGHVIVGGVSSDSAELDVRAVEHGATVLALELVKERVARATEERLRSDLLSDLVSGREDAERHTAARARSFGVSLDAPYRILVLELDAWGSFQEKHKLSEQAGRSLHGRVLRLVGDIFAERAPGSLLSQTGNRVTVAVPFPDPSQTPKTLTELVNHVRQSCQRIAKGLGISAGIGGPTEGPRTFPRSYTEAAQCLEVLRKMGRSDAVVSVDELGVVRLLLSSGDPDELTTFAHRVLGPALERDLATQGALIDTLAAYVDSGGHVQRSAAALFVHTNTVKYRLRRIEELCALDLKRPQDLLDATIAQLVLRLLSSQSV